MSLTMFKRLSGRLLRPTAAISPTLRPHRFPLTQRRQWSDISLTPTSLTVHSISDTPFPFIWLRDSCRSPHCVHPSTSQKLHRTSDIPLDICPVEAGVKLLSGSEPFVMVQWTDGHRSVFSEQFLRRHASEGNLRAFHGDATQISWDASMISKTCDLYLPYESLGTPSGLLKAIDQLSQYGLLFITGVPREETADQTCELVKLAHNFGEIRETFYGRVWDVRNVRNSTNVAYTNLDLGLHMDLLYFQHPPRYQILHCLRNRVQGGTSLFSDALRVAETLREQHPEDFDVLSSTLVPFHYINAGHHLHYMHPTIELESPLTTTTTADPSKRKITHINYSPPFQAPHLLTTPPAFYSALKRFASMLENEDNLFRYTLKEGDAVLFDNRRVLHARTAFSDPVGDDTPEGQTNRWLKGCYLEGDAMWDRGRVIRTQLQLNREMFRL